MKLLFFNQTLSMGGAESFNSDILSWLTKHRNYQVVAYTTNHRFKDMLVQKGIQSSYAFPFVVDIIGNLRGFVKGIFYFAPALISYLYFLLKHNSSDVIFMTGYIEKIVVTPLANTLSIPVVWLEYAPLDKILQKFFGVPKFLYKLVSHLPQKIIVPSENTKSRLVSYMGLREGSIVVIPLGIDAKDYDTQKPEYGTVLSLSRLEEGKGQDLLLKSWASVVKKIPQATLRIAGGGDFENRLRILAKSLGIETSIKFLGALTRDQAMREISNCQIFVFPSVWDLEGFGLVQVEAMALFRPVICFNRSPMSEVVTPDTGVLVKDKDTSMLSHEIIGLLSDPQKCLRLGKSGHARYLEKFTLDKIGYKYDEIFSSTNSSV